VSITLQSPFHAHALPWLRRMMVSVSIPWTQYTGTITDSALYSESSETRYRPYCPIGNTSATFIFDAPFNLGRIHSFCSTVIPELSRENINQAESYAPIWPQGRSCSIRSGDVMTAPSSKRVIEMFVLFTRSSVLQRLVFPKSSNLSRFGAFLTVRSTRNDLG
jgi:hypothetical protein